MSCKGRIYEYRERNIKNKRGEYVKRGKLKYRSDMSCPGCSECSIFDSSTFRMPYVNGLRDGFYKLTYFQDENFPFPTFTEEEKEGEQYLIYQNTNTIFKTKFEYYSVYFQRKYFETEELKIYNKSKGKYWNNQIEWECELVAMWNALKYYGLKCPKQYGEEYMEDCKFAGAIAGKPDMKKVQILYEKYGLAQENGELTKDWMTTNFPAHYLVWDKCGDHAVLCVGLDKEGRMLIANYYENSLRAIWWEDFVKFITLSFKDDEPVRPFKIIVW